MGATFQVVSLSYKTCPIQVRESVACSESEVRHLLQSLKHTLSLTDSLVLSTCNRLEVYYQAEGDCSAAIAEVIVNLKGIADLGELAPYIRVFKADAALRHLFRVALGLESQVVGDLHISHQVKRAYQYATDEGLAGPYLHRLMHTVFSTSKKVTQETAFRDGAASVSYATAELIRELTAAMDQPRILIIGMGEIGSDVCQILHKGRTGTLCIANRTLEKALALAADCEAEVIRWEDLPEQIQHADVVISAVPGRQPFLTRSWLERFPNRQYRFFIDLSMPRSVDTALEAIPGVHLYNIDDIRNKASQALEKRKAVIPQVEELTEAAIVEFNAWARELSISPVIQEFKQTLEGIRQQEMNRYAKTMTEAEAQLMETITRNMVQKMLKLPVLQLKSACQRGEAEQMSAVLRALFDLEKKPELVEL
jgi:glutamyl-tRNA reductase